MKNVNLTSKVYLIHGNQNLLVEETCDRIIDQILAGRDREWSHERFKVHEMINSSGGSYDKSTLDNFLISCDTFPMLTDRKIIQLDNFDLVKKSVKKTNENSSIVRLFEAVSKIINDPPLNLWFLFTSQTMREQDFSKPLFQKIKQSGLILKFNAYENNSPFKWLVKRADEKGLSLSNSAINLIIDIIGNDLTDLDHELEKLKLYFSDAPICEEKLRGLLNGHKHVSVFEMTEALSNKKLSTSLEVLFQQLQVSPREQVKLFALIVIQFRRILIIHCMLKQCRKESEILAKLSLPTFIGKKAILQAKNFSTTEVQNIYCELSKLDLRVKFKNSLAPLLLQDLFQRICTGHFIK